MAAIRNSLSTFTNILSKTTNFTLCGFQQVRNKYINRWMIRDMKRRKLAEEHAPMRLRLVAMKRNNILPQEIQNLVSKQIDETIPRQSALRQLRNRCILTSRGNGVVLRWRLSRIMFRHLADYNKLSGIQRAMW
ncbi:PREDICTED: 28S ribosomal protein S14, mitochondrial [Dufourea novaeangliae]|uniref:28S ribosomal protein S14, mitochondrial n=1 Tax=Dufourea novaeangliae TaxID=178035 RepID=A0A154P1Y1_DUFNO|nr:PREDICTED: 28S ribosomal protein S14, mitochondrial [Dufourea novaeangliae]KZC05867.1 28S ribosomal protein S14, mitochondrial [Dufourea novaeangliae]